MSDVQTPPKFKKDSSCYRCNSVFSLWELTIRHHCRACGNSFCHYCSRKTCCIPEFDIFQNVRVCYACYKEEYYYSSSSSSSDDDDDDLEESEFNFIPNKLESDDDMIAEENIEVYQNEDKNDPVSTSNECEEPQYNSYSNPLDSVISLEGFILSLEKPSTSYHETVEENDEVYQNEDKKDLQTASDEYEEIEYNYYSTPFESLEGFLNCSERSSETPSTSYHENGEKNDVVNQNEDTEDELQLAMVLNLSLFEENAMKGVSSSDNIVLGLNEDEQLKLAIAISEIEAEDSKNETRRNNGAEQTNRDHQIQCPICFEERLEYALKNCGHVVCGECKDHLSECPICRTKINGFIRVYITN